MSEKKGEAKYTTTEAFPEPNYTQTPNNFFDMLPDMEHSEVNVTLVMIRQTFGFHRDSFKMGLNKLAEAAGLSRNAAKDGAEAAEKRGTFRRVNPDSLGEAEWELVVGQPVTTLQPMTKGGQPVEEGWSTSDSQVTVKERVKKEKKMDVIGFMELSEKLKKQNGVDATEELIQEIERGIHVNIRRTTGNQAVAKRIIRDGRLFGEWLTWCISDEWRAAHLYIYADMEKIWRDFPQAFVEEKIKTIPDHLLAY